MRTQAAFDEGTRKDVLMTLYDSMVESYAPKSAAERLAVQQEVMQLIALAGLARGGFFEKAAFYGGTCLHLFYGMERFSEDMDFSLLEPDSSFDFESYFPAIKEEFALAGTEVEIQLKHKGRSSSVESAFLKESSEVFRIGFTTQKQVKVKIEVDIEPPPGFSTEQKLLVKPVSRWIRVYSIGDLFAGKVSAALFRAWHAYKGAGLVRPRVVCEERLCVPSGASRGAVQGIRPRNRPFFTRSTHRRVQEAHRDSRLQGGERRCPSVPEGRFMSRHLEPGILQLFS